jgi:hypothetical protein
VPYQPYATPQSSPQQPQPGGSGVVVAERAPNEFSGQTLPPGMFPPAPAHPQARRTSPGKRMLGIAAGVIGALIGTALVGGMLGTKTDNGQKRIDAYLSGEGAKEFFASDAQFRATFPSIPERTVKSVNAGGAQINVVFYMSGVGDDGGFAVSEFDVPAGVPFDLNMGVNGAAAAVGGHIESAVPASFGGYPAMEFLVSGAEGHNLYVRGLAIKAPSRVYILQVVDSVNPPPGYEKFKASFRIGAQ